MCARESSFHLRRFFSWASFVIAYARQPYALRWAMCGFLLTGPAVSRIFACEKKISNGVFQPRPSFGVRLKRYTAASIISFHRLWGRLAASRIALALSMITPPERSAAPFCSWVRGAEGWIAHPLL